MLAFLVHLRLHFQAMLAGIFLWAFLLSGARFGARALVAFFVLHVLLYGGTTAYNAWYDQDEGPVTGLVRPPPAGRACLWGGLAFMLGGQAIALWVGPTFALVYALIFILSVGYSHPRVRFKRRPAASLLVVAFGQGTLGYLAGVAAGFPARFPSPTPALVWGGLAATLLVTGLYPLTQVFQIEVDRARGDRTFAVRYGPRGVFATAIACFALGLAAALPAAWSVLGPRDTVLLAVALAALLVALARWSRRFDPDAVRANHDRVLALGMLTSAGFVVLVVRHLVGRSG